MNLQTSFRRDLVDESVFIAPNATVLGDVAIGAESSIWFGAVVRGDTESIRIGIKTNVQDLSLLHADPGFPCVLGDGVTVGHAAIVHGAEIADDVLIGMRAVVMNGAKIGSGTIVAAGAVVVEGMEVPPGTVVAGIPARVKRPANDRDQERIHHAADHYVEAAHQYRQAQVRIAAAPPLGRG
jgi:carbonic anhydrase/acetyltransferase-like protein (isoleucine patch superfamily)